MIEPDTSPIAKKAASWSDVAEAVQAIKRFYNASVRSLTEQPDRMKYGGMAGEAARFRMNEEELRKARSFANPDDGGYTAAEVDELIQQCRDACFPMGKSHIIVLLSVPRKERGQLQAKAIANHWRRADLELEKKRRFGKRRNTAKTLRPPRSLEEAYLRLAGLCGQWKRFHKSMDFYSQLTDGRVVAVIHELPPRFRSMLEQTTARIEALEREASKIMSQHRGRKRARNAK